MEKKTKQLKSMAPSEPKAEPTPEPRPPARVRVCFTRPCALGAGLRLKGEVVFTAERSGRSYDPNTVEPAEGITERELQNALMNPQLLEIVQ
jgi:hypothetical protein